MTALAGQLALYALAWQLHRHQRERRRVLPQFLGHPVFRAAAGGAILAAACWILGPTTSCRNVVPVSGIVLLLLSVPIYAGTFPNFAKLLRGGEAKLELSPFPTVRAILAEMFALMGAICAAELLWLAPPAAAIYAAWIFDRLLGTLAPSESDDSAAETWWPYLYPLVVALCAVVIGVKFVARVLPHQFL